MSNPLAANLMPNGKLASTLRFGCFELNLRSGELYRNGQKVTLPEQSFRILELLILSPGQVVTREEIRERLWPNGTIVEFENAVNAAIKKLRNALGDAADQPRYVETVKRRGYRLIVPVEDSSSDSSSGGDTLPLQAERISGERVSHYRVLAALAAGGMGVVYRAEDLVLGREVALKFLAADFSRSPLALARLRKEARSASALNHPNICTIYEIGEEAGQPFIAMELLEGCSLRERISGTPMPMDEVRDYGSQIAQGLAAAHRKGIVHRDIKPANIFITNEGRAKILDFGLAKATAPGSGEAKHLTRPGAASGTVAYMSPEQASAQDLDERSDLFSFGLVLHEMATGKLPRSGLPLSGFPTELQRITSRCLENDRELRYQTASEIRADLERLSVHPDSDPKLAARWTTAAIVAAVIGISALAWFYFRATPGLTDKDTIVLAEFTNRTGDTAFDGTLRQGLAIQLEQSPFLSLIAEDRIRQTLRLMGKSADAPLTLNVAREICERTGSAAVLEGSISRLGTQYVVGLRAHSCRSEDVLDDQQSQAGSREDVLAVLSRIARRFRSRAGESSTTVRKHDIPLEEATTSSLEALKAFSSARQAVFSVGTAASVPLFQRAIEIDPQFAMAYANLGLTYSALGESELSAEYTAKAYALRDHTSERERLFITVNYDHSATRNLERAQQNCELWEQTYPRDPDAPAIASGFISQGVGNYERSIEQAQRAIRLDPDHTFAYVNLAASYFFLNRFEQAKAICNRFSESNQVFPEVALLRYNIAFLQGDSATMQQQAILAKGRPGADDWLAHAQALVLARSGRTEAAKVMARRAMHIAQQSGQRERAASYEAAMALWEAFFGNASGAKGNALAARELSLGRDVEYASALALALSGEANKARELMNDLDTRFTEDTSVKFTYLPALRAALALHDGVPEKALEALRAAEPYELGMSGIAFFGCFGGLYPAYLRGEAYLRLHRWREAELEFQKILDHPGIVIADPIGALARLQLGRAYASSGDHARAKAAYGDFLTLWKDADPDISILRKARAEYAKLL